jgi:hypothetical protein
MVDSLEPNENQIPDYPVRLGEFIGITLGAVAIIGAGFFGLGLRLLNNAFNPDRAEAIAKTIVDYQIPGGSHGVFGLSIGGAKLAQVHSIATSPNAPAISLFVSKTLVARETEQFSPNGATSDGADQQFTVKNSQVETKPFCGKPTPVTVETGEQTQPYVTQQFVTRLAPLKPMSNEPSF